MAKTSNQKLKMLILQKILLEQTDENNGITVERIIELLKEQGISAERKSIYSDFELLRKYGMDICKSYSGRKVYYYIGERAFQLAELRLLVDAIQSSRFITEKKSLELICKLEKQLSENEGKKLQKQVSSTRVKTLNERIYYVVDALHNAICQNKQIEFDYMKWDVDFESAEHIVNNKKGSYTVSPWKLWWNNDNYYLIAYNSEKKELRHFRVDKIASVKLLEDERKGEDLLKNDVLNRYTNALFSMFGGEETEVVLSVDNDMVGVIVDRFGTDIFINKESENSFKTTVTVVLSKQFYGWLFGLGGKVRILAPKNAVESYRNMLCDLLNKYTTT